MCVTGVFFPHTRQVVILTEIKDEECAINNGPQVLSGQSCENENRILGVRDCASVSIAKNAKIMTPAGENIAEISVKVFFKKRYTSEKCRERMSSSIHLHARYESNIEANR